MEMYSYRCPICGFVYQVPAYWMSFSPEAETEFPHLSPITGQLCTNTVLALIEEM